MTTIAEQLGQQFGGFWEFDGESAWHSTDGRTLARSNPVDPEQFWLTGNSEPRPISLVCVALERSQPEEWKGYGTWAAREKTA